MNPTKPVYRITDLATEERPRERLVHLGAQALAASELLAILLRVGVPGENAVQVGQRLLKDFGGISGLQRAPWRSYATNVGSERPRLPRSKPPSNWAAALRSKSPEERPAVNSPADAAALVAYEMSALEQEHLRVILLDTRNRVLEIVEIYKGSVNSSQIHVGRNLQGSHPAQRSGIDRCPQPSQRGPTPSPDDVAVTRAIVQAGKLLDVDVLDHMVIGQGRWVSLKERGWDLYKRKEVTGTFKVPVAYSVNDCFICNFVPDN